jgi:hypothetical protein
MGYMSPSMKIEGVFVFMNHHQNLEASWAGLIASGSMLICDGRCGVLGSMLIYELYEYNE